MQSPAERKRHKYPRHAMCFHRGDNRECILYQLFLLMYGPVGRTSSPVIEPTISLPLPHMVFFRKQTNMDSSTALHSAIILWKRRRKTFLLDANKLWRIVFCIIMTNDCFLWNISVKYHKVIFDTRQHLIKMDMNSNHIGAHS